MARSLRGLTKIQADAQGNPPTVIELLRVGNWHTPWHGDFEITPSDIQQFADNAAAGVGLVAEDKRIPINYGHQPSDKAAGWITRVYPSEDGQVLLGEPEWTPAAAQALKDDEWKYISPEFNPRSFPWEDAEEEYHFVNNVIDGAALTNIPLFKKLKPVMASRVTGDSGKHNEGDHMDLQAILAKKAEERTEEEKAFLSEHAAELTAEQRKDEGLETEEEKTAREAAEKKAADEAEAERKKQEQIEASRSGGEVKISASKLASLEADAKAGREAAQELARTKTEALVDRHIAAGRIKSDQRTESVNMLMASTGDARKNLEAFMEKLPKSAVLASEIGSGARTQDDVEITDEERKMAEAFGNSIEDVKKFKEQN